MARYSSCLRAILSAFLAATGTMHATEDAYFVPAHRIPGVGLSRQELADATLTQRTEAMIQSQTFSIMREPQAAAGAGRITGPRLQRLFREAERRTGFPASVLEAIAYLESWGLPNAESPAGPRGIMQISEATGRRMGLRIAYATRHRVVKTKTAVINKHGRRLYRTVRRRETYTVLVRDDRLRPERAIPAAAVYLAALEQRYGGRDWAIWAYHCGEGCVADFLTMAKGTPGLESASVAKVFFGCNPVWNRELCDAIHAQMDRDYSPTYWFRVMRAGQLLRMYENDPPEFHDLATEYKYAVSPSLRAPDRLSIWLKPRELLHEASADTAGAGETAWVRAPEDPDFLGYRLDPVLRTESADDWRASALPSTIGTLVYIAFETRRLFEAMLPGVAFVPLDVTALAAHKEDGLPGMRVMDHVLGQVFDLSLAGLPGGERDCLRFVLDDLGWNGDLGFIDEGSGGAALHIGCAPSSRGFFAQVFEDAQSAWREHGTPVATPAAR